MDDRSQPCPPEATFLLSHMEALRRLVRGLVHGDAEADDVVQDTMIVALGKAPPDVSRPVAWLFGIAKNVARNRRRGNQRREAHERSGAREEAVPSTERMVECLEAQRSVLALARDLPEPYRTAVYLRYFEDLGPQEIARRLEMPTATVKTHLRRGLEQLRARLDERHQGRRAAWVSLLLPVDRDPGEASPPLRASRGPVPAAAWAVALAVAVGGSLALWSWGSGAPDRGSPSSEVGQVAPTDPGPANERAGVLAARGAGMATAETETPATGEPAPFRIPVRFDALPARVPTTVFVRSDRGGAWQSRVGEDGIAVFPALGPSRYVAWAVADGHATCQSVCFELPSRNQPDVGLDLVPATTLLGRVVEEGTEAPVAGALVEVAGAGDVLVDHDGLRSPAWHAVTDPTGRFTLDTVPATPSDAIRRLRVIALARGFALTRVPLPFRSPSSSGSYEVEIRMHRGRTVTGRVEASEGRLAPGAVVHAFREPEKELPDDAPGVPKWQPSEFTACLATYGVTEAAQDSWRLANVDTGVEDMPAQLVTGVDSEGRFTLWGLEPEARYAILVTHPDHPVSDGGTFLAAGDTPPITIRLGSFGGLRLRVLDPEGHPVPRACLAYRECEQPAPGVILLPRLGPSPLYLIVTAPGFVGRPVGVSPTPGTETALDVVLSREVVLAGTVRDAAGSPIAGARVVMLIGSGPSAFEPVTIVKDVSGVDGRFSLHGLPAGTYRLSCFHDGHRSRVGFEARTPGPPTDVVLESEEIPHVKVRLRPAAGGSLPPQIMIAYVAPDDTVAQYRNEDLRRLAAGVRPRWGVTFSRPGQLEEGLYPVSGAGDELVALVEGYAPARFHVGAETEVTVTLERGVQVLARVVQPDGQPVPDAVVALSTFAVDGRVAHTDTAGVARLEAVPAGRIRVMACAPGYLIGTVDAIAGPGGAPVRIELSKGVVLTGTVTGVPASSEEGGAPVEVRSAESPVDSPLLDTTWAAERTGRFSLVLPPGRYRLMARHRDRTAQTVIDLDDPTPHEATLDLPPAPER